jgi:enamine deaminase RidA (YjgF/YER057c/UK114 family)
VTIRCAAKDRATIPTRRKKRVDRTSLLATVVIGVALLAGCGVPAQEVPAAEAPEYFLLRPEVEKSYGYSHAVRIGDIITISGAVSMDDQGNPTAVGDLEQQMKNA